MLKIREPTLLDRDDGHWYQTKFDDVYPSISTILSATATDDKKNGLKDHFKIKGQMYCHGCFARRRNECS